MIIYLDDKDIRKAEKKLHSKCIFIDWRWWLYHFDNGQVYDNEELVNIIYDE